MKEFSFSDLNRRSGEVLDAALAEPVSLVKRGKAKLVVMPIALFEHYQQLVAQVRAGPLGAEQDRTVFTLTNALERSASPSSITDASKAERIAALRSLALSRYSARCFWNIKVPDGSDGDKVIVERLKKHGDMTAWRLATEIEALANAA